MAGNEQANGAEDIAGLPFLQTFEDFRLECLRCGDAEVEAFGAGGNNEGLEFVELQIDHNPFASSLDFPDDRTTRSIYNPASAWHNDRGKPVFHAFFGDGHVANFYWQNALKITGFYCGVGWTRILPAGATRLACGQ